MQRLKVHNRVKKEIYCNVVRNELNVDGDYREKESFLSILFSVCFDSLEDIYPDSVTHLPAGEKRGNALHEENFYR